MSEVRLIDANALLERVDEEREYLKARGQFGAEHILVHNFRDLIDNAPTVTNGTYEQGFRVGAYGRLDELRPKGKWVEVEKQGKTGDGRIFTYTVVVCSECGEQFDLEGEKFCPHCGADMRGDNNGQ